MWRQRPTGEEGACSSTAAAAGPPRRVAPRCPRVLVRPSASSQSVFMSSRNEARALARNRRTGAAVHLAFEILGPLPHLPCHPSSQQNFPLYMFSSHVPSTPKCRAATAGTQHVPAEIALPSIHFFFFDGVLVLVLVLVCEGRGRTRRERGCAHVCGSPAPLPRARRGYRGRA